MTNFDAGMKSGHTHVSASAWQEAILKVLKQGNIRHSPYVPDAGHSHVICLAIADPEIADVVLTTKHREK